MASTVSYNMGQIRYKQENYDNNRYMIPWTLNAESIVTESVSGANKYQDIILYGELTNVFSQSETYYLKFGIPRNLSYNMTFDLKLVKKTTSEVNRNQYQEIKRFVVPRDSLKSLGYSRVVLFPEGENGAESENISVAIAVENPDDISLLSEGTVYYKLVKDETGKKVLEENYYIKKDNAPDVKILYKNDILLNHTWKDSQSEDIVYFEFVFLNKVSGQDFNAIILELVRNSYDDDMSYQGEDGQTYNGLYIDPAIINKHLECYQLVNLVKSSESNARDVGAFSNIGVWSHPDAIMSINGEEIRIGQSGYYELNDFDITNFGIVVKGAQDRFSLDYQYKISG